ncbi:MAG TPA: LuxR family transcriptional regulator [Rhizomicrobium sp.]|jgi:LuxR family quorum sensing-dependent transcriptional regulator|nr:LuxR family transcriptional regulator [Rhizomicrobium sp.]
MLLTNATFEFIEDIDRQIDAPALIAAFQNFIRKFGMVYFMIGDPRPPPEPYNDYLWATTWPEEWLERWRSNYLLVDPIVRQLRTQTKPLRWGPSEGASDETGSRILEEASEFRMNAGFAVPVYNRDGLAVVVSMGTESYEIGKTEETCLHIASIYLHAGLERLRAKGAPPPRGPRLTRRERECLSWVAAGKTDWEISQILSIAEQTVHEYVQNALIKLNATTRAQAVAIAIFTKQIAP